MDAAGHLGDRAGSGAGRRSWPRRARRPRDREPARQKAEADFARRRRTFPGCARTQPAAARAEQQARTRLTELTARIDELGQLLQGAPDQDQITAQLALRDKLEAAASDAEQRLLKARAGRTDAQRALAGLEQAESAARARLSAARDPVVRLGAPALDDTGILAAWTALATWAAREAVRARRGHHVRAGQGRPRPARARSS